MNTKEKVLAGAAAATTTLTALAFAAVDVVQSKAIGVDKDAIPDDGTKPGMHLERKRLDEAQEAGAAWFRQQPYETHYMTNKRGEKLCAYYLPPKDGCNVLAFICHGYKSNAFRNPMLFARHYHEAYGYGLFFMDHTASGQSEGEYVGLSGFESDDCILWMEYINHKIGDFQMIVHGVSMGGATVCQIAGKNPPINVKFCIDDCGFTGGKQQLSYELSIRKVPVHPLIDMLGIVNKAKAGYSFSDTDAHSRIYNATVPILFFHGECDTYVPTYMGREMYSACPTDKELVIIPDATHAACVLYDPDLYWSKVEEFAKKYLD